MAKTYRELKVWQSARQLVMRVYQITSSFPTLERFGLVSQMRRCVVSIPSNIAEGFGRHSDGDFSRFLAIAMGSLCELETQTVLCMDLSYITESESNLISEKCSVVKRLLIALKNSLKKTQ